MESVGADDRPAIPASLHFGDTSDNVSRVGR